MTVIRNVSRGASSLITTTAAATAATTVVTPTQNAGARDHASVPNAHGETLTANLLLREHFLDYIQNTYGQALRSLLSLTSSSAGGLVLTTFCPESTNPALPISDNFGWGSFTEEGLKRYRLVQGALPTLLIGQHYCLMSTRWVVGSRFMPRHTASASFSLVASGTSAALRPKARQTLL